MARAQGTSNRACSGASCEAIWKVACPMLKDELNAGQLPADPDPAVGIVVHYNTSTPRRPRNIAFVWGGEDAPAPSLPFGRWKPGVRAA